MPHRNVFCDAPCPKTIMHIFSWRRYAANRFLVIYQDDSGAKGFAFGLGKGDYVCLFEDGEQVAATNWPDGSHTDPTWGLYPDINGSS